MHLYRDQPAGPNSGQNPKEPPTQEARTKPFQRGQLYCGKKGDISLATFEKPKKDS
jgi:hypothetical protein